MLKILSAATLLAIAAASFAQTTQPGQTTPSVTPSDTPAVTPSQTPAVTPSQTPPSQQAPIVSPPRGAPVVSPPSGAPVVGGPAPTVGRIEERAVGGLSKCENMLGFEKEKCLQDEQRAATGATTTPGATTVPGSTGMGTTTPTVPQTTPPTAPQNTAPSGSVR
jgi:hypothetical protein